MIYCLNHWNYSMFCFLFDVSICDTTNFSGLDGAPCSRPTPSGSLPVTLELGDRKLESKYILITAVTKFQKIGFWDI